MPKEKIHFGLLSTFADKFMRKNEFSPDCLFESPTNNAAVSTIKVRLVGGGSKVGCSDFSLPGLPIKVEQNIFIPEIYSSKCISN